jgi:hypothetical protein
MPLLNASQASLNIPIEECLDVRAQKTQKQAQMINTHVLYVKQFLN